MKAKNGDGYVERKENGRYSCTIVTTCTDEITHKNKRIKRTADTREEAIREAKLAAKAYIKEWEEHNNDNIKPSLLFYEVIDKYFETEISKTVTGSTYLTYHQSYKQFIYKYAIAKTQICNLSKKRFQNYYDTLTSKYAPKSIQYPIQLCRNVCEWLVTRSYIEENYAKQANPKYEIPDEFEYESERVYKKVFTEEDMEKLLNAYNNGCRSEYLPVVLFLCETGLRPQEFACLTNKDIDFENKRVYVCKSCARRFVDNTHTKTETYIKTTKTKERRYVPLSELAINTVQRMQNMTETYCKDNPLDLLYPGFRTKKVRSNDTMEVGFKLLCDLLNIERDVHRTPAGNLRGLNFYCCRHTCETMLKKEGIDSHVIGAMLGHSPEVGDKWYTHYTIEDVEKRVTSPFSILQREKDKETIHISADEIEEKMAENDSNPINTIAFTATTESDKTAESDLKETEIFKKLKEYKEYRDKELITEEEYVQLKQKLLGI